MKKTMRYLTAGANPRAAGFPLFINSLALYGAASVLMYSYSCASLTQAESALNAIDQALTRGAAVVVAAENLACEAAVDIDPSGATAVCTQIDAAGNATGAVFTTVATTAAAVQALLASTQPKTPAVVNALGVGHAAIKVRRLAAIPAPAKK